MEKIQTPPTTAAEMMQQRASESGAAPSSETPSGFSFADKLRLKISNGKTKTTGLVLGALLLGATAAGAGEYAYLKQTGQLNTNDGEKTVAVQNFVKDAAAGESCPPAPECKPEEKKMTFEKATGALNWGRFLRIVGVVDNAPVIDENDPIYKEYKDKGIDISAICFLKVPGAEKKGKGAGPKSTPIPMSIPPAVTTEGQPGQQIKKNVDLNQETNQSESGDGHAQQTNVQAEQEQNAQINGDNNTVNQNQEVCVAHGDGNIVCSNVINEVQPTTPPEPTPTPRKEDTERPGTDEPGGPPPTKW